MTGLPPRWALAVELWKQLLVPVLSFLLGAGLIIFDSVIEPPTEYLPLAGGITLIGLAPAWLHDFVGRGKQ